MKTTIRIALSILTFYLILICSCGPSKLNRRLYDVHSTSDIPVSNKVLKVHMNNGDLLVLSKWHFDNTNNIMHGDGSHFDASRKMVNTNHDYSISFEDIALFETNFIDHYNGQTGQTVSMSIVSLLNLIFNAICISDPKNCFGSCPTYYAFNGSEMSLQAEGFSSSMARVYEEEDLDMLFDVENNSDTFLLEIRNEALETHLIRYCDLLVVPRYETERVYVSSEGVFFNSSRTIEPDKCIAEEGDILSKIKFYDEQERYSLADSINLIKKETIDLTFPNYHKKYGLIITSRQTLMTTYLFYQTMAYFGTTLPYWTSKLGDGDNIITNRGRKMYKLLGGIKVYVENSEKTWVEINEIHEMGPIASDFHMIELPDLESDKINLRLEMTQGLWRIDYITLAELEGRIDPIRIQPYQLQKAHIDTPENLKILNDKNKYLVTFPGERYCAYYKIPENEQTYEYFILSKGYYMEWMREEWLEEEDKHMVNMLFIRPRKFMKEMAPKFKMAESQLDEIFWNSKIQTH